MKGTDGIYWIGMQTKLQFNISSAISGNYSNFDEAELGKGRDNLVVDNSMQRCAAIQAKMGDGRWLSRECGEKLGFICQI